MHKKTKVVLTGGGTAGHGMPHLALLSYFKQEGCELLYIGSKGIEKSLAESHRIPFKEISCGKLRRYFSLENFADMLNVVWGLLRSFFILVFYRPRVVFSKGGFVSVPVA